MQYSIALRRSIAVGAFMLGASCFAQDKQDAVPVKLGDTWTYNVTNLMEPGKSQEVVTSVVSVNGDRWMGKSVGTKTGESGFERSHDWQIYKTITKNTVREFKPYALNHGFPLEVGKTTSSESTFTRAGGEGTQKYDSKVVGQEKVSIGGQSVDAWVVESKGFWNFNGVSGVLRNKFWYAPAVRGMVRLEFTRMSAQGGPDEKTVTEMTSFKLAN